MEVFVGPTFGIEVAASTSVRDRPREKISPSCLFLKEEDVGGDDPTHGSDRGSPDVSSETSSSIGSPGESDDEEEGGVVSSGTGVELASLGSLEDSLPIKRGLSNHYAGKSKSFANLSDISTVKDLQKAESPFNKRRRVLLANKLHMKSSFYSWRNPNSMPLLALNEDNEDGEDKETPSSSSSSSPSPSSSSSLNDKLLSVAATKPKLQQSKLKATFKSQSCFSLADLQVEHQ
ncbi:uncharacterized protein LOC111285123 [Durio zibethinus]|uniref:Uncharacterized protein LOC111285123 n=1 Tax=Durio zibethinus TaxID=66656 RepID=A0A6P5XPM6_DURZI|nr:uncharacterized protein LOC111285123 [Durio zibethinus]